MNILKRLVYQHPVAFLNPLAQIFFFINLVDGIAFTFFTHTTAVQVLGLAVLTSASTVTAIGVILLIVSILNILLLITRRFYFGQIIALLGFVTWLFITFVYVSGGLWLVVLIHPLPQVAFWSWYYFMAEKIKVERK